MGWFASVVIVAFWACGCGTPRPLPPVTPASTTFFRVPFGSNPPTALDVFTHGGHVLVRHGPELRCDVDVRVFAETFEAAVARGATVRVQMESIGTDHARLTITHAEGAALDAVDMQFRLEVPPSVQLRVETRVGDVALRGARGSVEIVTQTGGIDARVRSTPGARLRLASERGPIRLDGEWRNAVVTTGTGRVQILAPTRIGDAEAIVRSASGPIAVTVDDATAVAIHHESTTGTIDAELPIAWQQRDADAGGGLRRSVGAVQPDEPRRNLRLDVTTASAITALRRRYSGAGDVHGR